MLLGHLVYLRCPYKMFICYGLVFVEYKYGSYVENQHMCKISDTLSGQLVSYMRAYFKYKNKRKYPTILLNR